MPPKNIELSSGTLFINNEPLTTLKKCTCTMAEEIKEIGQKEIISLENLFQPRKCDLQYKTYY